MEEKTCRRIVSFVRLAFWFGVTGMALSFFSMPIIFQLGGLPVDETVTPLQRFVGGTFFLSGCVAYPVFFAHIYFSLFRDFDLLGMQRRGR